MSSRPNIYVVEDNPDNMMLVEALLADRYELTTFESGHETLESLGDAAPSLFLLDISLPKMSGVELLHAIRKRPQTEQTPAIALTAHAMAGDKEKLLEHGFDGYVSKPLVDPEVLYAEIERVLDANG